MSKEELRLKNQICHRLYIASNGITRIYRPYLKPLGLTYPQYVIMMALWEKDHITMGELSEFTKIDKGFLATTIEKMEGIGLLKILADENDKRKKILALSQKGRKLEERAIEIPHKIFALLGGKKEDLESAEQLIRILDLLNETIARKDLNS